MNIDQTANARYGKIVLVSYAALNGLPLIVVCAGSWFLAARASSHAIAPNTSLGFRSQHTLASLHGWYVAQRVGFRFAAIGATIVTSAVFAIVGVAFIRRSNPMWILIVPAIGGLAVAGCFMIAGHYADKAAISVETRAAFGVEPMSPELRFRSTSIAFTRSYARPPTQTSAKTISPTAGLRASYASVLRAHD
jgi:hypothetical protein